MMILKPGSKWKHAGRCYRVKKSLGHGSYGEAILLEDRSDSSPLVLKCLFQNDKDDVRRLYRLRDLQLNQRLLGAVSVTQVVPPSSDRSWCGYLQPYVHGVDFDQWIRFTPTYEISDCILACIQIANALNQAHRLRLVHGDVKLVNVRAFHDGHMLRTVIVDWDNARGEKMPPPKSPGTIDFMAPEALVALEKGSRHLPDIKTERYSVARLFHWILFRRSSIAMADSATAHRLAMAGQWDSDPKSGRFDTTRHGGLPNDILSSEFADLFRRSLSVDRDNRPSMKDWLAAFVKVLNDGISLCPHCDSPMLLSERETCPFCNVRFTSFFLRLPNDARIPITSAVQVVGRSELKSQYASRRHAVLSKLGPECFVTDCGSTKGTFRLVRGEWVSLPPQRRCPLKAGDRVRFGDIETYVCEEKP